MNSTLTNSTPSNVFSFYGSMVLIPTLSIHLLLGFSLNCCIIFLLLSRDRGVDVSVVFMLNHTAAEMLYSIAFLIFIVNPDSENVFFYLFLTCLSVTSVFARLLFPCFVCLERYLAVVHPVIFLRLKPLRYRVVCSVLVWICALMLGISILTSEFLKFLTAVFLIIVAVEFFCCVSILRRLRDPGPRDMGREQGEMNAAKKKAFQIVSINLLTCLAQTVPLVVSYIIRYGHFCDDFSIVHPICSAVTICAGFVQPVMILYNAGKRCS